MRAKGHAERGLIPPGWGDTGSEYGGSATRHLSAQKEGGEVRPLNRDKVKAFVRWMVGSTPTSRGNCEAGITCGTGVGLHSNLSDLRDRAIAPPIHSI